MGNSTLRTNKQSAPPSSARSWIFHSEMARVTRKRLMQYVPYAIVVSCVAAWFWKNGWMPAFGVAAFLALIASVRAVPYLVAMIFPRLHPILQQKTPMGKVGEIWEEIEDVCSLEAPLQLRGIWSAGPWLLVSTPDYSWVIHMEGLTAFGKIHHITGKAFHEGGRRVTSVTTYENLHRGVRFYLKNGRTVDAEMTPGDPDQERTLSEICDRMLRAGVDEKL